MRLELDAHEADLRDLDAYGRAQERFEALGGWALEARLDDARRRLGIEHLDRGSRLGALSGGEAARCLLAAVLLGEPTVLLLDEPTNHLDADGRAWLAEWLAGFDRHAARPSPTTATSSTRRSSASTSSRPKASRPTRAATPPIARSASAGASGSRSRSRRRTSAAGGSRPTSR